MEGEKVAASKTAVNHSGYIEIEKKTSQEKKNPYLEKMYTSINKRHCSVPCSSESFFPNKPMT